MVVGRISALWWAIPVFAFGFAFTAAALAFAASGAGWLGALGFGSVGIFALLLGAGLWRGSARKRAKEDRIAATGARCEAVVLGVEQAGGQVSTNGRVTRLSQNLELDAGEDEPVRVHKAWLAPGTRPGHVAQIAYDRETREAVLLEVPRPGTGPAPALEPEAPAPVKPPPATEPPEPEAVRRPADASLSPEAVARRMGLGG